MILLDDDGGGADEGSGGTTSEYSIKRLTNELKSIYHEYKLLTLVRLLLQVGRKLLRGRRPGVGVRMRRSPGGVVAALGRTAAVQV